MKHARLLTLALALPITSSCDLSFDLDLGGFDLSLATVTVTGTVEIGPYPIAQSEGQVLVYAPSDTINPVDAIEVDHGRYTVRFGLAPTGPVCTYVARVRLWNGEESEIRSLFRSPPPDCATSKSPYLGAAFRLPDYPPLIEPFTVRGRILIDGTPAGENAATATLLLREGPVSYELLRTDVEGVYSYETTDQAIWFGLCSYLNAQIRGGGRSAQASLNRIPVDRCATGRTLPDVRIGSTKAAIAHINFVVADASEPVRSGDALAVLVDLSGVAASNDTARSLDDGTAHIWFPNDLDDPSCDWMLRILLADGRSVTQPLLPEGGECTPPLYHRFEIDQFPRPGDTSPLTLSVDDPIGDHTGPSDLTNMVMDFDPKTGAYEIQVTADSASLFVDSLRVNVTLYNATTNSFFFHTLDDRLLPAPTDTITLTGWDAELLEWRASDLVLTNNLEGPTPSTGGMLFWSSVAHFPIGFLTNEDVIAFEDRSTPAVVRVR